MKDKICCDCAEAQGARWPKSRVIECVPGVCGVCREKKNYIYNKIDWDWPKKEELRSSKQVA